MQLAGKSSSFINKASALFKKTARFALTSIVWVVKWLPKPIREKINQNDLFLTLCFKAKLFSRNVLVPLLVLNLAYSCLYTYY